MVIDNQVHAGDPDLSIKHRLLDQLHNGARGLHRVAVDLVGDLLAERTRVTVGHGHGLGHGHRPEKPKYSMSHVGPVRHRAIDSSEVRLTTD